MEGIFQPMILHPPYSTPSAACPKNAMNGTATFNDFQGQFFTEVRIDSILRFSAHVVLSAMDYQVFIREQKRLG